MSLFADRAELQVAVAHYLGWSRTSTDWTTDETDRINDAVRDGLRSFYYPSLVIPGWKGWSFMKASTSISIAASTEDQDLPEAVGYIEDPITWGAYTSWPPVRLVPERDIMELRQTTTTGRPLFAAVRAKTSTGLAIQVREILWYPKPDIAYTAYYWYGFDPDNLGASTTYPLGDQAHALTIKESCLAAAELIENDESTLHRDKFKDCLNASIQFDIRENAPATLGKNLNRPLYNMGGW